MCLKVDAVRLIPFRISLQQTVDADPLPSGSRLRPIQPRRPDRRGLHPARGLRPRPRSDALQEPADQQRPRGAFSRSDSELYIGCTWLCENLFLLLVLT